VKRLREACGVHKWSRRGATQKKVGTTDRSLTREMWTHGVNPIKSTEYLRGAWRPQVELASRYVANEKESRKCRQKAGRPRVREEQMGSRQELGDTGGRKCASSPVHAVSMPPAGAYDIPINATSRVISCRRAPLILVHSTRPCMH
jgi:hypothetical protein